MARGRARRVRAIVLDRTKLSEQDLIITLLADNGEELRAVAKGARKPGSRLASRTELFCEDDLLLAQGRTLDIVSEATTIDAHAGIRGELERVSAASAICEVARHMCFAEVEDPFLHAICSRALRACEETGDQAHLDVVVAAYVMKVLAHGGWRPELSACILCGDDAVSRISVAAGGVLCASCAKDVADVEEVDRAQVGWVSALIGLTFDALLASRVDPMTAGWLVGFAHRWAATHLDGRLRAMEFYLSV